MPATAHHLPCHRFTAPVIREVTRPARQPDAINLSRGFPDMDPPAELLAAAGCEQAKGGQHPYAIGWDMPEFRRALADKQSRLMGLEIDPDAHVLATCARTKAIHVALMSVCKSGDSIVVFSPSEESQGAGMILRGVRPIYVPLRLPDFSIDREALRRAFAQRPRAIVIGNPSSPCGKVFSEEELTFIGELAQEADAFIVADETYEHVVYAPHRHVYTAALPGLWERTLTVGSLSKSYAITGLRLGYVIAPAPLIAQARTVHERLVIGVPPPWQEAAATALRFPSAYYEQLRATCTRRRDLFLDYLRRAGLPCAVPQGADRVLVNIRKATGSDDVTFCHWLAEEIGVAAVPGSSFFAEGGHHLICFHFDQNEETLHAAGQRLLRLWMEV